MQMTVGIQFEGGWRKIDEEKDVKSTKDVAGFNSELENTTSTDLNMKY